MNSVEISPSLLIHCLEIRNALLLQLHEETMLHICKHLLQENTFKVLKQSFNSDLIIYTILQTGLRAACLENLAGARLSEHSENLRWKMICHFESK